MQGTLALLLVLYEERENNSNSNSRSFLRHLLGLDVRLAQLSAKRAKKEGLIISLNNRKEHK